MRGKAESRFLKSVNAMEAESGGFGAEPVQAKRGRILRNENGSQPKVVRRRFQGARGAECHLACLHSTIGTLEGEGGPSIYEMRVSRQLDAEQHNFGLLAVRPNAWWPIPVVSMMACSRQLP